MISEAYYKESLIQKGEIRYRLWSFLKVLNQGNSPHNNSNDRSNDPNTHHISVVSVIPIAFRLVLTRFRATHINQLLNCILYLLHLAAAYPPSSVGPQW